jgi:NAD(P)-dependent dehydrogenase (short-subunit alcohol dehydrogenase family)
MSLKGVRALITGGSQGFGLAAARAFVREGADVAICARGAEALGNAERELTALAAANSRVLARTADISREGDIVGLVQQIEGSWGGVDVLLANAGTYGPKGTIEEVDWTEWARAIEINLLGNVLSCRAVLPGMKARRKGVIVLMSGGGATNPMPRISAYAASKAGLVRFGESLAREVQEFGIAVNAIAPGALDTRLLDEVLEAGPEKVGRAFHEQMVKIKAQGGTPLEKGAELAVYLAGHGGNGVTGRLLSAVWDPWARLDALAPELADTDIYTLRRIVPKDRGKDWERAE